VNTRPGRNKKVTTSLSHGGAGTTQSPPSADLVTAADLLAGAVIPVRIHLSVTIRPGARDEGAPTANPKSGRLPRHVGLGTLLERHTPQVLQWAKLSADNANLLVLDPVLALAQAGVKLSDAEQRAVTQRMKALVVEQVLPPGVELAKFNVKIASE
jgi:hypothetical protein